MQSNAAELNFALLRISHTVRNIISHFCALPLSEACSKRGPPPRPNGLPLSPSLQSHALFHKFLFDSAHFRVRYGRRSIDRSGGRYRAAQWCLFFLLGLEIMGAPCARIVYGNGSFPTASVGRQTRMRRPQPVPSFLPPGAPFLWRWAGEEMRLAWAFISFAKESRMSRSSRAWLAQESDSPDAQVILAPCRQSLHNARGVR